MPRKDIDWPAPHQTTQLKHSPLSSAERKLQELPTNWQVVFIGVSETLDCLIMTKYRHGSDPVTFRLGFDRLGRREEEEDLFTYDLAIDDLRDIIKQNNALAQGAKLINTTEGRQTWWTQRRELDDRMRELLESIDKRWLGAFKVRYLLDSVQVWAYPRPYSRYFSINRMPQ